MVVLKKERVPSAGSNVPSFVIPNTVLEEVSTYSETRELRLRGYTMPGDL